ncbi:MAG: hypothetical protein QM796_08810 [Chthoniobacteraceae bacterium]
MESTKIFGAWDLLGFPFAEKFAPIDLARGDYLLFAIKKAPPVIASGALNF